MTKFLSLIIVLILYANFNKVSAQVNTTGTASICQGVSTPINATLVAPAVGDVFTWTPGGLIGAAQNVTPPATTIFTVTAVSGANTFTSTVQITVIPLPTITAIADKIICNSATNAAIPITSSAPSTFSWTNSVASIGLVPAGSTNPIPSFVAINASTTADVIANISVTPTTTVGSCVGVPELFSITVKPTPVVAVITDKIMCNAITNAAIPITSSVASSFNWTNSLAGIGLAGSGITNPISSFIAINTGATALVANISVTPTSTVGGCIGAPRLFTITVNPTPVASIINDVILCNSLTNAAIPLSSNVASTFSWTNSLASIGLAGAGVTNPIPSFVATNASSINPVIANISVTPTSTVGSCVGAPRLFTITVNPTPLLTFSSINPVCNDAPTAINITSSTLGNNIFNFTSIGTSALDASSDASPINSLTNAIIINQQYDGITTATSNRVYTFTVTSVNSCTSVPVNYTQNVFQKPALTITAPINPVCNDVLNNINIISTTLGNNTLSWTSVGTSLLNAVSDTPPFSNGSNNMNINEGYDGSITVATNRVFTFTNISSDGCASDATNFTQNVFQKPALTITAPINPVCNDVLNNINIISTTLGNNTLSWTSIGTSNIHASSTASPLNSATNNIVISERFDGLTTGTSNRVFTFTNTSSNGCISNATSFTQNIFEKPTITTATPISICSGIVPTINVSTDALELLNWSIVSNDPLLTGIAPNLGTPIVFNNALSNSNSAIVRSATYNFIPVSNNGCNGVPKNITIDVKQGSVPTPIANQVLCNNANTSLITFTSNAPGSIFTFTNSQPSIGLSASGGGAGITTIPIFAAINTTTVPINAVITVIDNAGGCAGGVNIFTITVNPTPIVIPVSDKIACNGTNVNTINFSSIVPSSFAWTNNNTTIGVVAAGTVNVTNFTATNASNVTPNIAAFNVTPTSTIGGCIGATSNFLITVNPTPIMDAIMPQSLCNNTNTTQIDFSPTTNTYNWSNSDASIGLALSGSGASIATFTAINTSPFVDKISTITVTPTSANGCAGASTTFSYRIYPTPNLSPITNQTKCNNESTNSISLIASTNSNFTWTNSLDIGNGLSGSAPAVANFIGSFIGANSSNSTPIISTFTVVPTSTPEACVGASQIFTIRINPTPSITPIANINICNNGFQALIPFTSSAPSTFKWLNNNPNIGLNDNGIGNIASFTAENSNLLLNNDAQITVTPTSTNMCTGATTTFTISVFPSPSIRNISSQQLCNNSSTQIVLMDSGVASNYNWVNNNTLVGLGASGTSTNSIAGFIASNTSNVNDEVAVITITPSTLSLGCTGASTTFSITVNPTPIMTLTNPDICNTLDTKIIATPSTTGVNTFKKIITGITNLTGGSSQSWGINIVQDTLTSINFSNSENINYVLAIKSEHGCTDSNGISSNAITQVVNPTPKLNVLTSTICSRDELTFLPTASTSGNNIFTWNLLNNNTNNFTTNGTNTIDINSGSTSSGLIKSVYMTAINIPVKTTLDSLTYLYTITSDKGCINNQTDAINNDKFKLFIKPTPNPFVSILPINAASYCKNTKHQLYKIGRAGISSENIAWKFLAPSNTNIYQSPDSANTSAMLRSENSNSIIVASSFEGFGTCSISDTVAFLADNASTTADPTLLLKKYINNDVVLECLTNNINGDYKWGTINKITLEETIYITEKGQEYLLKTSNNDDTSKFFYWAEIKLNEDNCNRRVYLKDAKLGLKIINTVPSTPTDFEMKLYPNPTNYKLNIDLVGLHNTTECSIMILDVVGNVLYNNSITSGKLNTSIQYLQTGCYLVVCKQNGKTIATQKIIKN